MTHPKAALAIFAPSNDRFDGHIGNIIRGVLSAALEDCERPTLRNLSEALELDPRRLARMIAALDLADEFREARKRAFKKYKKKIRLPDPDPLL